jgi:hypothetical protein
MGDPMKLPERSGGPLWTWNGYGIGVHQQRGVWTVPIACHIWTMAVAFRLYGPIGNDNGRPVG